MPDKSVEDEPTSGQPTSFDEWKLLQLVNENTWQIARELAEALSISAAVEHHLKQRMKKLFGSQ